jgi:hypothetical protein
MARRFLPIGSAADSGFPILAVGQVANEGLDADRKAQKMFIASTALSVFLY